MKTKLSLLFISFLLITAFHTRASTIPITTTCGTGTTEYVLTATASSVSSNGTYKWYVLKDNVAISTVIAGRTYSYNLDLDSKGNGVYSMQVDYTFIAPREDQGSAGLLTLAADFSINGGTLSPILHCYHGPDTVYVHFLGPNSASSVYVYQTTSNTDDNKGALVYSNTQGYPMVKITNLTPGYYIVETNGTNDCQTRTIDKHLEISSAPGCSSPYRMSSSIQASSNYQVSPNPVDQDLLISGNLSDIGKIVVLNEMGQSVKILQPVSSVIQFGDLKSGMYMVQISLNSGEVFYKKVVKN